MRNYLRISGRIAIRAVGISRFALEQSALRVTLRLKGVSLGEGVVLHGTPIVTMAKNGSISIGDHCVIVSRSSVTALGVNHASVIRAMEADATVQIGAHVGISGGSICAARRVVIGDHCLLGANVLVCDTDFHVVDSLSRRYEGLPVSQEADEVEIGNNVFIGANSIVLRGSVVGANSVIGAGSVVKGRIAPNSVCVGNPARPVRTLRGSGVPDD